jgi:hypothetical protein
LKSKAEPEKKPLTFYNFTTLQDALSLPENSVAIIDEFDLTQKVH